MKTPYIVLLLIWSVIVNGQLLNKLPDTGQTEDYTAIYGEDSDYLINSPSFTDSGNGTLTDNVTGLMWQKEDGGEMTWEEAVNYCDELTLGELNDWRLPAPHEAFMILDHSRLNPALNTEFFTSSKAQYWWCSHTRVDDDSRVWATNSGGGIGPHKKSETLSAGGDKKYHARCIRGANIPQDLEDNGDSTITDHSTGLIWQKYESGEKMTWESALTYCENLSLAGHKEWRLPNIKELQSVFQFLEVQPAIDHTAFPLTGQEAYWSSTTMLEPDRTSKAWMVDFKFGIVSYDEKTELNRVRSVSNIEVNSGIIDESSLGLSLDVRSTPYGNIILLYTIPERCRIIFTFYAMDGREVRRIAGEAYSGGIQKFSLKSEELGTGIFFVTLRTEKSKLCSKFVNIK